MRRFYFRNQRVGCLTYLRKSPCFCLWMQSPQAVPRGFWILDINSPFSTLLSMCLHKHRFNKCSHWIRVAAISINLIQCYDALMTLKFFHKVFNMMGVWRTAVVTIRLQQIPIWKLLCSPVGYSSQACLILLGSDLKSVLADTNFKH